MQNAMVFLQNMNFISYKRKNNSDGRIRTNIYRQ